MSDPQVLAGVVNVAASEPDIASHDEEFYFHDELSVFMVNRSAIMFHNVAPYRDFRRWSDVSIECTVIS